MKGGGTQLYFKQPKIAALTEYALVHCHIGATVLPLWMFLADLIPQMLQNVPVVMLFNSLS
jgi:hypothetical protein